MKFNAELGLARKHLPIASEDDQWRVERSIADEGRMTVRVWKNSTWRASLLRLQSSSLIRPSLRRRILNSIGANIHPTAIVNHSCWFGSADIVMGRDTMLNAFAFWDGRARLTIEEGGRVAARAMLITSSHEVSDDPDRRSAADRPVIAPITIGAGSWVGANCTIMPGVSIAKGCVIGAGAVVRRSTRANGVYVGVPAERRRDLPSTPAEAAAKRQSDASRDPAKWVL